MDYSRQLLVYFVESFCNLYGNDQLVYNVHSLIHLADDAQQFGVLDNVSAFKFESYLGQRKKVVRRPQQPCAQIVRRIMECKLGLLKVNTRNVSDQSSAFRKPHMEGPITLSLRHCQQYKQYTGSNFFVSSCQGDNCFLIGGKVDIVQNIIKERGSDESGKGYVLFEEFEVVESFSLILLIFENYQYFM